MAARKSKHRKSKIVSPRAPSSKKGVPPSRIKPGTRDRLHSWSLLIFLSIAFLLYGKSISYGYILDDQVVLSKNVYVQQGVAGFPDIFQNDSFLGYYQTKEKLYYLQGGRYRPLSLATFAVEVSVFGPNHPGISHFINILLYALTAFMLFHVFLQFVPHTTNHGFLFSVPFFAAILWIFHPIHTECVANIKGRDELLALIFSLAALMAAMKYEKQNKTTSLISSGVFIFLGMLAKENALTFIGIIPLSLWVFQKASVSRLIKITIPLVIAAILFIVIRYEALGYFFDHGHAVINLINDSFLGMSNSEKYATIFYTLGLYIKLLFIPYPLTHDYLPYHIPIMQWADVKVIASLFVYLGLFVWSIYNIKARSIYAYCVLFFLISLSIVSNIFVSIGTFMNERFLYTPSVAFALAIGYFLVSTLPRLVKTPVIRKSILTSFGIILAICYTWITLNRVSDWRDSLSLDTAAIKVSKNSARANCFFAVSLYQQRYTSLTDTVQKRKLLDSLEYYINKAITIYPEYVDALHMKTVVDGARYENDHNVDTLLTDYLAITKKIPDYPPARDNIISYAKYLFSIDAKKTAEFCYTAGYKFYFKERKDTKDALIFLQLPVDANYNDPRILSAAAEVYEASGDKEKATDIRKRIQ
jgi:protein O-mannosyl-transferase